MTRILKQPIGIVFLLIISVAAGLFTASLLPLSMYPPVQKPTIEVSLSLRGLSTEDAYKTYQVDIQSAIAKLKGVLKSESQYYPGWMGTTIEFDYDKDREEALQEVTVAFEGFRRLLPTEEQNSLWIGYPRNNSQGKFSATIYSQSGQSLEQLYDQLRPYLDSKISNIPDIDRDQSGLRQVNTRELVVEFRPIDLAKYGLFLPNVVGHLRNQITDIPSGRISGEKDTIYIRTVVNENTIEDLQNIVVSSRALNSGSISSTRIVKLSDIANVFLYKKAAGEIRRAQGQPALIFTGEAIPGGNLWLISNRLKEILVKAKQDLGNQFDYRIYLDPGKYIDDAIRNMLISALIGTLIAVLVIFLFLGQFRSTLLVAISIPSSLAVSILLMKASDINLNMISLGGMALAVGMIVDSSIVVLENIFRYIEMKKPKNLNEKIDCIVEAVKEVRWPVIVSTLTSVIVFLPLSFTSAMANAILGDMSRVVVFALCLSIIAAIIYLPIFSVFLIKTQNQQQHSVSSNLWNHAMTRVSGLYIQLLDKLMGKKRVAFFFSLALLCVFTALSALLLSKVEKEIIAKPDALIYKMNLWSKYINDREKLVELVKPMEEKIMGPEFGDRISGVVSNVSDKWGNLMVLLKPGTDAEAFGIDLEREFPHTPDLRITISRWNPTSLPIPKVQDINVVVEPINPGNIADAQFLCGELVDRLQKDRENGLFQGAWCQPWRGVAREVKVSPHRSKLQRLTSELGLNISARNIADFVQIATYQKWVGRVFFDGELTTIYGRYPENSYDSIEKIKNLPVSLGRDSQGNTISYNLKTFAKVESSVVPPMVSVVEGKRVVRAVGNIKAEKKSQKKEAQIQIKKIIEDLRKEFPKHEAVISYRNPYEEVDKSIGSLSFSLLLSLVLIFSLLVLQFHSLSQSLIIMLAIPLGIFGVLISLFVFGSTLSLNSMLGTILLSGIAVNNSILLVDFYNSIRKTGIPVKAAILEAIKIRFRPIVMTMMTTIFAMLPIALSIGSGGKTLQPLGIAVSGGLLISTLFTLILVPLALYLISQFREEKAL